MLKTKIKIRFFSILLYTLLLSVFPLNKIAFAASPIDAKALDTIAGYSTILSTSIAEPEKEVTFRVEKADGGVINLFSDPDPAGIAKAEFLGYHTKKAGLYKVYAFQTPSDTTENSSYFRVFPDTVSKTQSSLTASTVSLEANEYDSSFIRVVLRDKYNNPIPDHQVELISSRSEDTIEKLSSKTDETGEIQYKITSKSPGISTLIASDITSNVILQDRVEIVFFAPSSHHSAGGNELLLAELLAQDEDNTEVIDLFDAGDTEEDTNDELFGTVDHFEIVIEPQVGLNEEIDISILAKDANNKDVKDYMGEISFAIASDENAIIPNDYSFTEEDQGQKTFNLALKFTKLGVHEVEVFDTENWDINGIIEVEVVSSTTPSEDVELEITAPEDGLVTSQSVLMLSGEGSPTTGIIIFQNDSKIGETTIEVDGKFSYNVTNLTEGDHTFYVIEDDTGEGKKSNSITVTVDLTGATVESFTVTPDGPLEISSQYNAKLISEPNLDKASIIVNGIEEQLQENRFQPGVYEADLIAPAEAGDYPILINLLDQYQNKSEVDPQYVLQVVDSTVIPPPRITGLEAEAKETSVMLNWDLINEHDAEIVYYNIYYGENPENLSRVSKTPDAKTTFEVENLSSNTRYYFAVTAVDNNDVEGDEKSIVVEATPQKIIIELQAVPSDSQATLTWNTFPEINATQYKIYYGVQSKKYTDSVTTEDNKTTYVVKNLMNGSDYYFMVAPIENETVLEEYTTEATAKPIQLGDKPLPPPPPPPIPPNYDPTIPPRGDTGPATTMLILGSMLFSGGILKLRKKFIVGKK